MHRLYHISKLKYSNNWEELCQSIVKNGLVLHDNTETNAVWWSVDKPYGDYSSNIHLMFSLEYNEDTKTKYDISIDGPSAWSHKPVPFSELTVEVAPIMTFKNGYTFASNNMDYIHGLIKRRGLNWSNIPTAIYTDTLYPLLTSEEIELFNNDERFIKKTLFKNNSLNESFMGPVGAANKNQEEIKNLELAKSMENQGAQVEGIKLATGWERGYDGNWKYEWTDGFIRDNIDFNKNLTLYDVWDDDELYSWYPDLKYIKIDVKIGESCDYASAGSNYIQIPQTVFKYNERDVLAHEIQHCIQHREGWKSGAPSPNIFYIHKAIEETEQQKAYLSSLGNLSLEKIKALYKSQKNTVLRLALLSYFEYVSEGYTLQDLLNQLDVDEANLTKGLEGEDYYNNLGEKEAYRVMHRMNLSPEERKKSLMKETKIRITESDISEMVNQCIKQLLR